MEALNRRLLLAATMMGGLAAPALVQAQDAPAEVEALVVTGSRLPTDAFNSPAPVQVIRAQDSALRGLFDAGAILQNSTLAAGSPQQGPLVTGFIESGGPGVATLSLRGLGDQRTLVLMNGRRLPPAGVGGQVGAADLNILPGAAIDRYEILKDGASSVYGSDAVGGVVNIITEKLDGGRMSADVTVSQEGGGEERRISGAYGRKFDTSRYSISAEWYEREGLTLGDRAYLDCPSSYTFDPATGARNDILDAATGGIKCVNNAGHGGGFIPIYEVALNGFTPIPIPYAPMGTNYYYAPESLVGPGASPPGLANYRPVSIAEQNYDLAVEKDTTVLTPVERFNVFAEGEIDFGAVDFYAEALWTRRESEQKDWQSIFQPVAPLTLIPTPPFMSLAPCVVNPLGYGCPGGSSLPPGVMPAIMAPSLVHAGFAPFAVFVAPNETRQTVDVKRLVMGLRGDLGSDWTWDASISASRSDGEYFLSAINAERVAGIAGVDRDGNLLAPCWSGGCTLLNFFADEVLTTGTIPQSYLDYLQIRETGKTTYDQIIVEAYATGTLAQLPGGPLGAVIGASFRRDELDDRPGPESVARNYWGRTTVGPTKGSDSVGELFGELSAPVAETLTLSLSGRYSNYDSYGSNGTYKLGANWRVMDGLRVRATYGASFRAPALYEQSLADQIAFLPQSLVDPCIRPGTSPDAAIEANCTAAGMPAGFGGGFGSAELVVGGGSDLEPEESVAGSFGVVWTPSVLGGGLQLAADYWTIAIDNEVASLGPSAVAACYASPDYPASPLCDLFVRNTNPLSATYRSILSVDASYRNIVKQTARGIDFESAYARDLGPGRLSARTQITWTLEDERELFAGRTDDINGVIGQPEVVALSSLRYDLGPWSGTLATDFVGEQSNYGYQFGQRCDMAGLNAFAGTAGYGAYCAKNHVEAVWTHHASVRYAGEGWSLTGGVRNLFDEQPPFVSEPLADRGEATYSRIGNAPATSQYDLIGRRFFVSLNKRF